eukprot:TRINITY_DN741_c0_g2_i3.p1 TRINITY_DN741_c0_g2~~TRINITY_DN741_c0_g2_i3.p1  ORF type:complete len:209 (-),score=64.95 TRINITY_DN741_c0_g2_i3:195-821(-)
MANQESISSNGGTFVEGKSLNILMLGESQVGKTALIKVYNGEKFPTQHYTTLGTEFIIKVVKVGGENVKAKIWDTAGQERFRTITKAFYQQAQGILLVYDMVKRDTYSKLGMWMENIRECTSPDIAICLVANKSELTDERVVTAEEGKEIAKKYGMEYYETSARLNKNVKEAFEAVITKAHKKRSDEPNKGSFRIVTDPDPKKKKTCC